MLEQLPHSTNASYRRGTIMGLTAAEAFMIICFILLLLLLWRYVEAQKKTDELIVAQKKIEELTPDKEVVSLITLKDNLNLSFKDVERGMKLLTKEHVEELAKKIERLSPKVREQLSELADNEDFGEQIDEMANPFPREEKLRKLEEFMELNKSPQELSRAIKQLGRYEATGKNPKDIKTMTDRITQIEDAQKELVITGKEIQKAILAEVGELIDELGGEVTPDGNIVFSYAKSFFETQKWDIKPDFDTNLQELCPKWFKALHQFDGKLRSIQIEGHASPEWVGAKGVREAFEKNLYLSQNRAAAVFLKCLDYGGSDYGGDDVAAIWARGMLAAIGYSSSHFEGDKNSEEDKRKARRVVFSVDILSSEEEEASGSVGRHTLNEVQP